ncbi:ribbon-helix-helix domain-containing protein [Micromonospora matsumotoense]|uniref:ribbon-helix-helix domain-containing protein n=1 Tax=Micromonospora matsumotoense TaxID=121616 RepID=UPI003D909ADA
MTPSVVDQPTGELYNSGMAFTLNLKPEVEQRLKELAEAEHRSMHKTVEVAVQAYLDRHERDEWTRQAARRVFEDDAEFFEMLGDR